MASKENKLKARAAQRRRRQRDRLTKILLIVGGIIAVGLIAVFWPSQPRPEVAETRLNDQPFLGPAEAL